MNDETVPRPVEGPVGRLERYGIVWKSPTLPICALREDGYWTPWHVAQAEIDSLRAENERLRDELAICCELKRLYSDRLAEALTTPNAAVTRRPKE